MHNQVPKKPCLDITGPNPGELMTWEYVKRGRTIIRKGLLRHKKKKSFSIIRYEKRVCFSTKNYLYIY